MLLRDANQRSMKVKKVLQQYMLSSAAYTLFGAVLSSMTCVQAMQYMGMQSTKAYSLAYEIVSYFDLGS